MLFTPEQMAEHACLLAGEHQSTVHSGPNRLLGRLDENERLLRAYNAATYKVDRERRITPASEWILDNFYVIEEQIQVARQHFPKGYSRELPRLLGGRSVGLPRVYDIILEFVSYVDAQVEVESIEAFLSAYQVVTPLTLGELWAVPIMIRIALIENLRRITDRLNVDRRDRNQADSWVQRLEAMAQTQPSRLVVVVAEMAESETNLSSSFVAEFCQRLAISSSSAPLARSWIEQHLSEHGSTVEQLVRLEGQNQAADQVSVRHTITGLKMLSVWDWRSFVEDSSLVERILLTDPADVYRLMDFGTRDSYRHVVEAIARYGSLKESDVAEKAVLLAEAAACSKGRGDRASHVGFYLVAAGRPQLEEGLRLRWPVRTRIERAVERFPETFYIGSILFLTVLGAALFEAKAHLLGLHTAMLLCILPVLLLSFSHFAVAFVNWLSSVVSRPHVLPRLDYAKGIAPESRTMVVVPTLVPDTGAVERLLEMLEIHHLANRDPNLNFALLTDFTDALAETLPTDAVILRSLKDGIAHLNTKYGSAESSLFYLFHRPRRWNEAEGRWMGYERKRGKIFEFNAMLRGGSAEAFSEIVGNLSLLPGIRFVITLDTDTQLPPNAARFLAATLAHSLNRPCFDADTGVVVDGYSILQPRVGVSLPGAGRSWFSRLFAGDVGIDPYTKGVSDVYQDLFKQGSFIGKGIYDVDAFVRATEGRFPDNAVLSHDLIESCFARSALVTDVELYEETPFRYIADVKRRHRWIRGDWQIAPWLLAHVPTADLGRVANPLSVLSQWKIFDNLRRSLVPLALLILLLASWMMPPALAAFGTLVALGIIAAPMVLGAAYDVARKPDDLTFDLHLGSLAASLATQSCQILFTVAFLPYDAVVSTDAIARTLYRMVFTRRHLLEWVSSGEDSRSAGMGLVDFYATMWFAPFLAVATIAAVMFRVLGPVPLSAPLILMWIAAPLVAWRISQPIVAAPPHLSEDQLLFLRATARRTWNYFEEFVTAKDHGLPPDNYQEQPVERLATRTSPTNMGLSLLSHLVARDLGYLSVGELLRRTDEALGSMERLERHHGHFLNWYDTRTLEPLQPSYISTVDSGNLAGHLLTLGPGLLELAETEVLPSAVFAGLCDTTGVLRGYLDAKSPHLNKRCGILSTKPPATLRERFARLGQAAVLASGIGDVALGEASLWARRLREGIEREVADVTLLAPWLTKPGEPEKESGSKWHGGNPTLRELAAAQTTLEGAGEARKRIELIEGLVSRSEAMAVMDFAFLFDPARKLLATGFNVSTRRRDNSYYDLLASEARLASYVAIALGQVSQDHWFALSRLLVAGHGEPALASWSGSMFEYLMPVLVMPTYPNTLLGETCRSAVGRQVEYGRARGVPWGISESGYNLTDAQLNYQYKAFGVPGLGLKRGLAEELVVAPYASMMAVMVTPAEACENLQRLEVAGRSGVYGFYEAVDYTPSRVPKGQDGATIRSYMVHHQGMGLIALGSFLCGRPMQRRFLACPALRASELLLQERIPHAAAKILSKELEVQEARKLLEREAENAIRVFTDIPALAPETHLLSNGRYHLVVSQSGGGYSRWRDLAVTRWREDSTRDCWGTFIYLRDTVTNEFWSAAPQPALQQVKGQEAIFSQGRAEFRHTHLGLDVHTEICVSPEDDVELRRVTLTNPGSIRRSVEFTGFFEVVLAPVDAEASHPAFSNLFIQTEFLPSQAAVLCSRRVSNPGENPPWLFSILPAPPGDEGSASCETDRSLFIGRGRSAQAPAAMTRRGALSNSAGPVLDPAVALRRTVTVPANGEIQVVFALGISESRSAAELLIEKYKTARVAVRAFELAWTHSHVTLRQLNISESQIQLYQKLGSALVYAQAARRAPSAILLANRSTQEGLWRHGISGDLPLALLVISDPSKVDMVQQLLQAHASWRVKGFTADLVILNGDDSTYRQTLHEEIMAAVDTGTEASLRGKPGGVFVLRADQIAPADRVLLQACARVMIDTNAGSITEQLDRAVVRPQLPPAFRPTRPPTRDPAPPELS